MSIAVLQHRATSVTELSIDASLEPGAILVVGAEGDPTLEDLVDLIGAWRRNPWCAAALLAPAALRRSVLLSAVPGGMRVEAVGDTGDVAAVVRAAIRAAIPSSGDCSTYLANRLGTPTAAMVAKGIDPTFAGTGARRALARNRLPPPIFWRELFETIHWVAGATTESRSEARVADVAGVSVKTVSRRCSQLLGLPWREAIGFNVWEAVLELGLRHRGLVAAG
jgi:hypothetical protein